MREPGDILLVSCYEMGHQPLSLASPLGMLRSAGFPAASLDVSVEGFDEALVARARFVGISVPMHTAMRLGLRAGRRVRAINPDAHVCFYGLYATLNAQSLLGEVADSVIGGEFETPLLALVESLARDDDPGNDAIDPAGGAGRIAGEPPKDNRIGARRPSVAPAGVVTIRDATVRDATFRGVAVPFLGKIPFRKPDRSTLPGPGRYARLERDGRMILAGYTESSRGCLHHCRHCPIPPVYAGRFFVVPPGVVLDDIAAQIEAGAGHITFGDPDFLNGPGHVMPILREMHRRHPDLTFDMTTKIEHILRYRELFPEMARLGCLFVTSAVESLSDEVLRRLDKGHTRADIGVAIRTVHASGISLRPSLLAFTPWTTIGDYREMLEFVRANNLVEHVDPVYYSIRLLLPPGSLLLSDPTVRPLLGRMDDGAFTYEWSHPDPRMDELHGRVSRIVEEGATAGEETGSTFERVAACAGGGTWPEPGPVRPALHVASGKRPPRMTESWFC